jgi:hypothetical protein
MISQTNFWEQQSGQGGAIGGFGVLIGGVQSMPFLTAKKISLP